MFTVIGLIGGIGIGILFLGDKGKKKEKQEIVIHHNQIPRSIQDYYNKQNR